MPTNNKAQRCISNNKTNNKLTSSPFHPKSITHAAYIFLRENSGKKFTAKQINSKLDFKDSSIWSALKRLVDKHYILKFKYPSFCEFAYPSSTLEIEKELWDITQGLPHSKMHNIRLFHQFKQSFDTYGVEHLLGGKKGERIWTWGYNEQNKPIQRKIKWFIGYNKGKKKPPSIDITMSCTERPLSLPDDWLAFLIYLDGMLSLQILEKPSDWKLLSADFHTDYPLGPSTGRLSGACELDCFTNALCRLYDKQIDGLWYRREEIAFSEDANFAPTLEQWKVQQNAGVRPDYAQSAIVAALNTISRESRATRMSQKRLEKNVTDSFQDIASVLKDVSVTLKKLNKEALAK